MNYSKAMNWNGSKEVAQDVVSVVAQAYGINHNAASDLVESAGVTIKKKRIVRRLGQELLET